MSSWISIICSAHVKDTDRTNKIIIVQHNSVCTIDILIKKHHVRLISAYYGVSYTCITSHSRHTGETE